MEIYTILERVMIRVVSIVLGSEKTRKFIFPLPSDESISDFKCKDAEPTDHRHRYHTTS